MNSILNSIKILLGYPIDYIAFDTAVIIHINSAFSVLHELGVGPRTPYKIIDASNTWNEFIGDNERIEMAKTYVYCRVKVIFDPPDSSFALNSLTALADEMAFRLNCIGEEEMRTQHGDCA